MARFRRVKEYDRRAKSVGVKGYRREGTLVKSHRRRHVKHVEVMGHLQHI